MTGSGLDICGWLGLAGSGTCARAVAELGLVLVHWPVWALVLLVWAGMAGYVARGAGFHRFFRDDKQILVRAGVIRSSSTAVPDERIGYGTLLLISPAFWSQFAAVALAGVAWIGTHSAPRMCPGAACAGFAWGDDPAAGQALAWVLVGALVIGLAASLRELRRPLVAIDREAGAPKRVDWRSTLGELGRGAIGGVAGIAAVFALYALALWAGRGTGWNGLWFLALLTALPLAVVGAKPWFLACLSVTGLFIGLALVHGLLNLAGPAAVPVAALVALLWLWLANAAPFKLRLPGFPAASYARAETVNPDAPGRLPGHPAPLEPVDALRAWHAEVTTEEPGTKPKLVLVATSGGAYRAGFWTAMLLDKLGECDRDGKLPGIARNIRLITGASGGMVGGAYFAALAARGGGVPQEGIVARIEADTVAHQRSKAGGERRWPIRRDSLTAVLQQMLRRDLPSLLLPWAPAKERGRVLDDQWETLHLTFAELRAAEAAGRAPSIVFSPMLVESGAPAFFANLKLDDIRSDGAAAARDRGAPEAENSESVEVFAAFPEAYLHDEGGNPVPDPAGPGAAAHRAALRGVTLATAVRLNATFPYISPAVSLPTGPSKRRLVDAGYYDNYGVDLATAYLNNPEIRDWAVTNCSGVAVLQVRAFPEERPVKPASRLGRALHFVTSPAEALFAARAASQMFRNNQQLRLVRRAYPEGFLEVFTFEASVEASMSWYLADDELAAMKALLVRMETEGAQATGQAEVVEGLQRKEPGAEAALAERQVGKLTAQFQALRAFWMG
jgi:hypothetical protein